MINHGARRVICCGFQLVKLLVLMILQQQQNLFSVEQNYKIQFVEKDWSKAVPAYLISGICLLSPKYFQK
jgi:hypothetical protein